MKYYKIFFLIVYLTTSNFNLNAGGADFLGVKNSRTVALNGIFLAGSDGIIGSRYNPAMLSNLSGFGIEFTALDKLGDQSINALTGNNYTSFRNDDFNFAIGVFAKVFDNIAIGLTYSPDYLFDVDWPFTRISKNESSSIVNAYDLKNNITIRSISPIVSFNFGDFRVGISANIYSGKINYSYPVINSQWDQNIGLPGYELAYDMEGFSYGFTIGFSYVVSNEITIAFAAQSSQEMEIDGKFQSDLFTEVYDLPRQTDIKSAWEIPWKVTFGSIYRLNSNLAMNLDLSVNAYSSGSSNILAHTYTNDEVETLVSTVDSVTGLSGLGLGVKLKSSFDIGIGMEYVSSKTLSYRLGYLFNQSVQDNSMYSHLFPNVNQHWLNAGIGIVQNKFLIDLALSYVIGVSTSIESSESIFRGDYSSQLFMPSLTIKYTL